jgi:hypothetical protein
MLLVIAQQTSEPNHPKKAHTRITITLEHKANENVIRAAQEKHVTASRVVTDAVRKYFMKVPSIKPANQ